MKITVTRLIAYLLLMVLPMGLWAQNQLGRVKAARVTGAVYKVNSAGEMIPVTDKTEFLETDGVATGADSSVVLVFENASTVRIGQNSLLIISEFAVDPLAEDLNVGTATSEPTVSKTTLSVIFGEMVGDVRKLNSSSSYSIKTPVGAAGIRGTNFLVSFDPTTGDMRVAVATGLVEVTVDPRVAGGGGPIYPSQRFMVGAGQEASGNTNTPDGLSFLVNVSQEVIAAIIKNSAEMSAENDAFIFHLNQQRSRELQDAFTSNEAQRAQDIVETILQERQGFIQPLTLSPEEKKKQEQLKRLEAEREAKLDAEKKKQEQLKRENEALLKKLEEEKEKQQQAKKDAEEAAKAKALEEFNKKLSDAQKVAFEKRQAELAEQQRAVAERAKQDAGGGAKSPPPPVPTPPALTPSAGIQ